MTVDAFALRALLGDTAAPCHRAVTGEHGVALPPFVDHHVHLHLIDEHDLASHGISGVVDLGGDPIALRRRRTDVMPHVAYAGAFLTTPGGYPSGRSWAPPQIVREITDASLHSGVPGGAATAVDEQAEFGASVVKVALNADAGPVWDAAMLRAVVTAARGRGLPVVAHVEGAGMTRRALEAGVDALAHTPFTEIIAPDDIARAVALRQVWISTLSIHVGAARERALANLSAFASAGGRVLYGTDLGNGDRASGIQLDEVTALDAAGIRGADLIAALADPWPFTDRSTAVATFIGGAPPLARDDVPAWLAGATVVPVEELIHDDH